MYMCEEVYEIFLFLSKSILPTSLYKIIMNEGWEINDLLQAFTCPSEKIKNSYANCVCMCYWMESNARNHKESSRAKRSNLHFY